MNILILGHSEIARRRLLPALEQMPDVAEIEIASKGSALNRSALPSKVCRTYRDYGEALTSSHAPVVYISLSNDLHVSLAERALGAGKHVVVDKPLALSLPDLERLVALSRERSLLLAEAVVYPFHPQLAAMRSVFTEYQDSPLRAVSLLTFELGRPGNFRYDARMGGGALYDLGPYAVSLGRVLFNAAPLRLTGEIISTRHGVESAFIATCSYEGGRVVTGLFGWDTAYRNEVQIVGSDVSVAVDRFFTTPPEHVPRCRVQRGMQPEERAFEAADAFREFLSRVMLKISAGDLEEFRAAALEDGGALARLRQEVLFGH